jgi:hypothetical protein
MRKVLVWIGIIAAAAAAGGCLTGQGAVRGDTVIRPGSERASAAPAGSGARGLVDSSPCADIIRR